MRGSRVKDIVKELQGEKIDIVRWNDDVGEYLKAALSPAEITRIKIDKTRRSIEVTVKEEQLSIAIGKHGQNVRLASKLIGWELDIRAKDVEKTETKDRTEDAIEKIKKINEKKAASNIKTLNGVGKKSEATLLGAGYDTVEKIAGADPKDLGKLDGIGKKTVEKIIASAKEKMEGSKE